mmetsp:Transcript_54784/g.171945  ORF Transcript_54784/g.171945 Transcript_54784/m.171945 type:complete len:236 (-) Transcript_54784:1017-1724(-)
MAGSIRGAARRSSGNAEPGRPVALVTRPPARTGDRSTTRFDDRPPGRPVALIARRPARTGVAAAAEGCGAAIPSRRVASTTTYRAASSRGMAVADGDSGAAVPCLRVAVATCRAAFSRGFGLVRAVVDGQQPRQEAALVPAPEQDKLLLDTQVDRQEISSGEGGQQRPSRRRPPHWQVAPWTHKGEPQQQSCTRRQGGARQRARRARASEATVDGAPCGTRAAPGAKASPGDELS